MSVHGYRYINGLFAQTTWLGGEFDWIQRLYMHGFTLSSGVSSMITVNCDFHAAVLSCQTIHTTAYCYLQQAKGS